MFKLLAVAALVLLAVLVYQGALPVGTALTYVLGAMGALVCLSVFLIGGVIAAMVWAGARR